MWTSEPSVTDGGKKPSKNPRTIGQLGYLCCDKLEEIRFAEAILLVLDGMKESFVAETVLSEKMIQSLLDIVFNNLPTFLKRAFNPVNSRAWWALAA